MLLTETQLGRLGPRARAAAEALEFHFRAEIAEALIAGKAPKRPSLPEAFEAAMKGKKPASVAELVLSRVGDVSRKQRLAVARRLMTEGLDARDRLRMSGIVDPQSPVAMVERTGITKEINQILGTPKSLKRTDPETRRWLRGILAELMPDQLRYATFSAPIDADGRPDDQEPPEEPTPPPDEGGNGDGEIPEPADDIPPYNRLELFIERVHCLKSTRGEWKEDEMAYGGVAVDGPNSFGADPSQANATLIPRADLGNFDDGISVGYNPPLAAGAWNLAGKTMPHTFMTLLALAELDPMGGFGNDYLPQLLTSVEAEIPAILGWFQVFSGAYMAGAGVQVGAIVAVAVSGGPIGVAILAIALLITMIVGSIYFLFAGNMDDVFDLRECMLLLDQWALNNDPFFGNARSQTKTAVCQGDHGFYEVHYHWLLSQPNGANAPGDTDGA